jgi:hypothetical protein
MASGAGLSLVQNGWRVVAQDGRELGRVTLIENGRMIIDREGVSTPGHLIVPRDLIDTEDEGAMRVFLSIDSASADKFAGDIDDERGAAARP